MTIAPRRSQPATRWERAYVVAAALGAAQFLWIFLMGLVAGGQFVHDAWPNWDPIAPWPVLAIPAWVTIAIGLLGAVAAVAAAAGRPAEPGAVVQEIAFAVVVLIGISIFVAGIYRDPSGLPLPYLGPDARLGWHWLAAVPQVVITLPALAIRMARARRARRAQG